MVGEAWYGEGLMAVAAGAMRTLHVHIYVDKEVEKNQPEGGPSYNSQGTPSSDPFPLSISYLMKAPQTF